MSSPGATALFVDTSAFYARLDERDQNHARARAVFDAIETGDLVYRPLYTTGYVLGELVALTLVRADRALAADVLDRIRTSPGVEIIHPDASAFATACDEFHRYDDQDVSLVDHLTGVLAGDFGVDRVFTFDADHFRTLGFTVVPGDTGDA